jgi:tol-pal system protein YbgF
MRALILLALTPALLLAGCASNPADDPVQIKLNDMDTRLGRVERVVSNQSLVDLSRRVDVLEAQLREQRGAVEVLQNGNESAAKTQRAMYVDLDKRIAALENGLRGPPLPAAAGGGAEAGAGSAAGAAPGAGSGVREAGSAAASGASPAASAALSGAGTAGGDAAGMDDRAAYARAFETLKRGDYGDAIGGFQRFMKDYPASTLLDNAQYWIGEAYYVTRDYERAAQAFRAVGERWPTSRKAPDAMLKLGYTQFELKHLTEARATLSRVVERFPGSDAAQLAQERLQKLPPEGR